MIKVKVCGVQLHETIDQLSRLAVRYVGFVFAPSKRQVTAELASELAAGLPAAAQRVGVFVDETADEIRRIAEVAGLNVLQLHGDQTPEFCQQLQATTGLAVWKSWSVCGDERDEALGAYVGKIDALLLDNERGGSGRSFAWEEIPRLRSYAEATPLFVAGGLHTDNVLELIQTYRPDGVDVSSGVETVGVKDPEKIASFVQRVREQR